MNARVDNLLHEALQLPTDERSALALALFDSLDSGDDRTVGEAWRAEVRRRREALRAGRVTAVPWNEAKSRLSAL